MRYDNSAFGNTARDIILTKKLDEERAARQTAIDNIRRDFNCKYGIALKMNYDEENGNLVIGLYAEDDHLISEQEVIMPTATIWESAELNLSKKQIEFYNSVSEEPIATCDIKELIADYTDKLKAQKDALEAKIAELDEKLTAEETRAKAAEKDLADDIDLLANEEDGRVSILEQQLPQMEQNLQSQIVSEANARVAADEALEVGLDEKIAAETTRATGAENALSGQIASEADRAQQAEGVNAAAIATEKTRAEAKELELEQMIAAETERAETEEIRITDFLGDMSPFTPLGPGSGEEMNLREALDYTFDEIGATLSAHETTLDAIDTTLTNHQSALSNQQNTLAAHENRIHALEEGEIGDAKLDAVQTFTRENTFNRRINICAGEIKIGNTILSEALLISLLGLLEGSLVVSGEVDEEGNVTINDATFSGNDEEGYSLVLNEQGE